MAIIQPDPIKLNQALTSITQAVDFLKSSGKSPKILIKIARNLGDTLHGQPIIRHYRNLHPNACIVFMCEQRYHGAHELNKDINKIFVLPNDMNPQTRLALWDPIKSNKDIDIAIIPSINPFQSSHPENLWTRHTNPNIVDQYLYNAGIKGEPLGGRLITVDIDDNDRQWANNLLSRYGTDKFIGIEYNSYSAPRVWNKAQYEQFVQIVSAKGWHCVAVAGANEALLAGAIDARGATWRQTVALLSHMKFMLGCASGNTALALASRPQPVIIELDVPYDVIASNTGYIVPGNKTVNMYNGSPINDVVKRVFENW